MVKMIEIQGLNAGYGKTQVLYDINFSAKSNGITVIIGPNGSGKSTLLKTIMGLTSIYSGTVKCEEEDITKLHPYERARLGMAYLPQTGNIFASLTVKENLVMAGLTIEKEELYGRINEDLEMFPEFKNYLNMKATVLSGGQRQMLAMAMALLRRPKVMMFDEPTGNLSPKLATEVFEKIMELRDTLGLTILLVEQNAKKALEIGNKAYLLVSGRLAYEGEATGLLKHPEFGRKYIGL